jgi:hypothetical protein
VNKPIEKPIKDFIFILGRVGFDFAAAIQQLRKPSLQQV